jgi:hypothetical protein
MSTFHQSLTPLQVTLSNDSVQATEPTSREDAVPEEAGLNRVKEEVEDDFIFLDTGIQGVGNLEAAMITVS